MTDALMIIRFDQPALLLLALVALPLAVFGWRATAGMDGVRRVMIVLLRTGLVLAVAAMLAGPRMVRRHDHLTVIGLLDVSGSVRRFADLPEIPELGRRSNIEYLRYWFRRTTELREPDDRFGLIVFDGDAIAISPPTRGDYVDDNLDAVYLEGTNIADAIRLGLAMLPADTAKRIVLVTDGNQTAGDALEAARQAARSAVLDGTSDPEGADPRARRSIPIDIVPVIYRVRSDVQIVRVEAPPNARPGQTVTVRILIEATQPASGRLTLLREGASIDINGSADGASRAIDLPAGQSVHLAQVKLGETPVNRFRAVFEPDAPADDLLPENNAAEAFTATPSKGSVLIVDSRADMQPNALAEVLAEADLPAAAQLPQQIPHDLLSLQRYDLIILDNVAAFELTTDQQALLARYVNDLGGGLIMVGGEDSFGAGGWNGTPLEDVLPVELDPPKEMILPTAALVLVLDKSGSMGQPVAGARASQQTIANEGAALAIESLREDSLIGVVTFDAGSYIVVPLQRNERKQEVTDRVRAIRPEGGTNLAPALVRAHRMLREVEVAKKRVVCLSDGQSRQTDLDDLVEMMAQDNIRITTIAVGDDADQATLARIAELGGGEFYSVRNPRTLPRVLVDSVQVINKPLIKEVPFTPEVRPTGSTLTAGMSAAPVLDALVVTAPRDDPKVTLEMTHPDGDPLLAHWQAGLGRAAAFTSDAGRAWSRRWIDWPEFGPFWAQLARTIARPAINRETELLTEVRGDRLVMTFEAVTSEGEFMDYLQVDGTVYRPDGSSAPVRLPQVGPGRYEGEVAAPQAGNYIVALNPRRGERRLAPVIGGASRATSPEYRRYETDLALLDRIVEVTEGRRLDVTQPLEAALFDRSGMPSSVSILPAWRTFLWAALALLLLDVACRRITWSWAGVRAVVARALAKVTPSHVRGEEVAATLASLREVSTRFDEQLEERSAGLEKLQATGRVKPPPKRTATPERDQSPTSQKISAALDVIFGRRKPQPPPVEAEKKDAPAEGDKATDQAPAEEPNIGSTETTSGLLAAKRRARKRLGGGD